MIYDKQIKIKKKNNNEFTISFMINDETIIVKSYHKKVLQQLNIDVEQLLNEGE